jgi:hypothetical protein
MTAESSRPVPFYKSPFVWAFIVGAISLTALRPIALAMRKAPPPLLKPRPPEGRPTPSFRAAARKPQSRMHIWDRATVPQATPRSLPMVSTWDWDAAALA